MKPFNKIFFFISITIFCNNHLLARRAHKKVELPYVTLSLCGQLGNQMYQIATTLAYAWDHQLVPLFPALNRKDLNIPMNHRRVFFRLNVSPLPRPAKSTFYQYRIFEKIEIPEAQDLILDGYFQSWQYFDHHRERIIDLFAPHRRELDHIELKYAELLRHPCTVGVHVRTFNKRVNENGCPFVGLDYYEKAMSYFPPEALFVVFSDRIHWCKHHFKKFSRPITFIEGQDHIEELFLMSMLNHNIIGNSTFSWWAAYLNKKPNKIVIAPSLFNYAKEDSKLTHANLPEWIVLDIDSEKAKACYPDDMYDYDIVSQSIDTQREDAV